MLPTDPLPVTLVLHCLDHTTPILETAISTPTKLVFEARSWYSRTFDFDITYHPGHPQLEAGYYVLISAPWCKEYYATLQERFDHFHDVVVVVKQALFSHQLSIHTLGE